MSSKLTENYQLCQWERTDKVLMEDFNADNAKIDGALAALAGSKADTSALDALARTVSGHTTSLSRLGNCGIQYFTYTGTGTCGQDKPTRVVFSVKPVFLLIFGTEELVLMAKNSEYPLFLGAYEAVNNKLILTTTRSHWDGNTLAIHSYEPITQMNRDGILYHVVAFYSQDGR